MSTLLRFITAGSVDDGKSTLIGRLLYDSKALFSDQLQSLTANEQPDFAALTDGLEAEREQGITIDVAYRYFATPRRKFIIADTPGHEQYTRNMVTGASTADAAIVLIDATRVRFDGAGRAELLVQTKRHSALLQLLGCEHILVAVNKLDLLGFDRAKYEAIVRAYGELAATLGIRHFQPVPISALQGDNIVRRSEKTPWYTGEALLPLLESLPLSTARLEERPLILPVQRVLRLDGSTADDFRGYQGRVEQGQLRPGDRLRLEPQGREGTVKALYDINGPRDRVGPGENVTVELNEDVDLSRGDCLVGAGGPGTEKQLHAALCWFDQQPLNPARRYLLKQGVQTVAAKVRAVDLVLDPQTLSSSRAEVGALAMNDIASVRLALQQPLVATDYRQNRKTGAFILIDESSNQTVAAGIIRASADPDNGAWAI